VTGVQTCALPICSSASVGWAGRSSRTPSGPATGRGSSMWTPTGCPDSPLEAQLQPPSLLQVGEWAGRRRDLHVATDHQAVADVTPLGEAGPKPPGSPTRGAIQP